MAKQENKRKNETASITTRMKNSQESRIAHNIKKHSSTPQKIISLTDFITFLTLGTGFLSVLFSAEKIFNYALAFLLFAFVCDFLDGKILSIFHQESFFGSALRALASIVAFAVAPALLLFKAFQNSWFLFPLVVFMLAAALKWGKELATKESRGLPLWLSAPLFALLYFLHLSMFWNVLVVLAFSYLLLARLKR
ncbi:hypothetical protein C4573_00180 [Candidatus Woesearchaeota archaeon]|nr:MAG: hypothetical protein C4573_00180 [Candidatus Woesearchaeota archaeon]